MNSKEKAKTIPSSLENPVDNLLYAISYETNKFFKYIDFTPNAITSLSLFLTILGVLSLFNQFYKLAAVLIFLGYFFDCSDGNFARTYNMESEFGDKYDHVSDFIKIAAISMWMYKENYINKKLKKNFTIMIILLSIISFIQLGCQDKIKTNQEHKSVLSTFSPLCINNNMINYTKYLAGGTCVLIFCVSIYNIEKLNLKFK